MHAAVLLLRHIQHLRYLRQQLEFTRRQIPIGLGQLKEHPHYTLPIGIAVLQGYHSASLPEGKRGFQQIAQLYHRLLGTSRTVELGEQIACVLHF